MYIGHDTCDATRGYVLSQNSINSIFFPIKYVINYIILGTSMKYQLISWTNRIILLNLYSINSIIFPIKYKINYTIKGTSIKYQFSSLNQ